MRARRVLVLALLSALAAGGCDRLPGKPRAADRELEPGQVMSFGALFAQNCAGCHGADGRLGAARPLNDALYLALVPRERLRAVIAAGVPGTAQPAFAQGAGGTLSDAQIDALVQGILTAWGRPVSAGELPRYAAAPGDAARGHTVQAAACARCHGPEGRGRSE